ncbi:uncharacterized protein LOC134179411 [Corticium candelabrum]|uniref:uncharacterized protein LOC134179411 n=1 Tax=Corticium candelabrum TaxID=121492 RepID=UPI002E271E32|nr:uncharacterized protein LOC134179411 [Corticium candelabrum]
MITTTDAFSVENTVSLPLGKRSHKHLLASLPATNNGKAGYLFLTASTDDIDDSSANTDEVVATEELNPSRPDGRRLLFPAGGLVRFGRRVWKTLRRRRRRFFHVPSGVRRAFSRNDLSVEAPVAPQIGVRTSSEDSDDNRRSRTTNDYSSSTLSRLFNALAIDERHTPGGSECDVEAGELSQARPTGNAQTLESESGSDDMFWDSDVDERPRAGFLHVNTNSTSSLAARETEEAPPRPPPRLTPRLPPRLPRRLASSLLTPRLPVCQNVGQNSAASPLCREVTDARRSSPSWNMKSNQEKSHGREASQKWSGHDPLSYRELVRYGWYWGPLKRAEANEKLTGQPVGTFLIRDCSDERHLYAISFVAPYQEVKHALISYHRGRWSFYREMLHCEWSLFELVERSLLKGAQGIPALIWDQGSIVLRKPLSRFHTLRSLQHHCRFVIRLQCRIDLIAKLPLPSGLKEYLKDDIM